MIEIFDLETDSLILSANCKFEAPSEKQGDWFRMIDDAAMVADYFGLSVKWPATVSEQDAELLAFLRCFMDGRPIGKGASFKSVVKKTQENATFLDALPPCGMMCLPMRDPFVFFGTPIKDKAFCLFMKEVRIMDIETVRQQFARAGLGEEIEISYVTESDLLLKLWDKHRGCPIERPALSNQ